MKRHLLVTVSDDPNVFHGVRFVSRFFHNKDNLRVTLFCSAPAMPENGTSLDPKEQSAANLLEAQVLARQANMEKALEEAKRHLEWSGFNVDTVDMRQVNTCFSTVHDISEEMILGNYDALVMGRRGLNRLWRFAEESITSGVLKEKLDKPIWICRQPDPSRKNVLLCVDGSEESYRAVEHIGVMMADQDEHNITLCRIVETYERSRDETMEWFDRCQAILADRGVPAKRVRRMIYPSEYPAQAIMDNADWGRFALVALGRTGARKKLLKRIFIGVVTETLFRELNGAVLCMVP